MVFRALLLPLWLALPARAAETLEHPYWALPSSTAPAAAPYPGLVAGEYLEYDIYWGMIYVGSSYLKIERAVEISSRPAWHIVSEAKSGSFINAFYKVADRNDAWLDARDLQSYGYYKKIQEGGYFFNEWVIFDSAAGKFYGRKMGKKREASDFAGPLEGPVNDVLSALYRVRTLRLKPGENLSFDVNTRRNWKMNVKAEKIEKISTPYGKKKCLLVEPMAGEEGIFVAKAGKRMLVWITEDELRVPMLLKAEIFIGSVTAKLVRRTIVP